MSKFIPAIAIAIFPLSAAVAQSHDEHTSCPMPMHGEGQHDAMGEHDAMTHGDAGHGSMHGEGEHGSMMHGDADHGSAHGDGEHGSMMHGEDMHAMHDRCHGDEESRQDD